MKIFASFRQNITPEDPTEYMAALLGAEAAEDRESADVTFLLPALLVRRETLLSGGVLTVDGEPAVICGGEGTHELSGDERLLLSRPEDFPKIAEKIRRITCERAVKKGVFILEPDSTYLSPLAEVEAGAVILPDCYITGRTFIGKGSRIGPSCSISSSVIGENCTVRYSVLSDSSVMDGTTVGPYANLRPDTKVGKNCRIGDFVELKNSVIGDGTKVSHLTYIGDSDFGKNINVGCGVVTVNYDGKKKYRTRVGDNAFIGCNVNLVSPVNVGNGGYIAAGTTVTEDTPEGALIIGRARAEVKPAWVKKRKEKGLL